MSMITNWVIHNWLSIMAWVFEFFVVIFCIHGIFGKRFKVNLTIVIMVVIDILIFSLILEGMISNIFTGIAYIMTFLYCRILFKKTIMETLGSYIFSVIVAGFLEVTTTFMMIPVVRYVDKQEIVIFLMNTLSLIGAIIFYRHISKKKRVEVEFRDIKLVILIVVTGMGLLFLLLDYRYRNDLDRIYYLVFMGMMIVLYFYWARMQKAQFDLEKKTLELEMQEIYGETYKELIFEVRRKQHDFKNQLSAIYSMHLTATSLEDLICKQKRYGDVLVEECRYDKILTGCSNPILAGYLYYKCVSYEKDNVFTDYKIHIDTAECSLSLHEVIEILGILLTNAYESVMEKLYDQRKICLAVEEVKEYLIINVGNPAIYITSSDMERIFENEYSSKGKNRGIGLTRVKQLVKKSEAEFIVENQMKYEENWVNFKIIIPK